MALIPALSIAARKAGRMLEPRQDDGVTLPTSAPGPGHAIVVGYGRVGRIICTLLEEHGVPFTATDFDTEVVSKARAEGRNVFYGDAKSEGFLKACGVEHASGLIVTIQGKADTTEIVAEVRRLRPDMPVVARARDAAHARALYGVGASHAVPETIEASLQLCEAALMGLGHDMERVTGSIDKHREGIRDDLRQAALVSRRSGSRMKTRD